MRIDINELTEFLRNIAQKDYKKYFSLQFQPAPKNIEQIYSEKRKLKSQVVDFWLDPINQSIVISLRQVSKSGMNQNASRLAYQRSS